MPLRWLRRTRRHIYRRVPMWVKRNDFQIFAAILCCSAGLPLLLTQQVDAASIDATLPPVLVKLWAAILAFAPVAIVVGLWKASGQRMAEATFWLRLEAYGLRALAYAAYVYALAIFIVNGVTVAPALAIILAFALTCHSRATAVTEKVEDYLQGIGVSRAH